MADHRSADLISVFNRLFSVHFNTRLVRGSNEPIYLPANSITQYHQIIFAHGYFSSALHEIAHWCVAGEKRRQQEDYGYWYMPDGRNAQQQSEFEQVEVKPQALEWIFSFSCAKKFSVSVDNLNGEQTNSRLFKAAVYKQVLHYCEQGLPERADLFYRGLCQFYHRPDVLLGQLFSLADC
ncbi:MAG: elongation factor P hydroxylase [Spongiibacteraceae bacterium]|nr:elongation factor P hydroxylase [Spongiibacteraceae bacterium]